MRRFGRKVKTLARIAGTLSTGLALRQKRLIMCNLYLSFHCNFRCSYCNFPNLNADDIGKEQWYTIIDELASLNCCRITLLGGEPLLYPHLADIIQRIRYRGMTCIIASNGYHVPERINMLLKADTLVLSLDAPGPEHDINRSPKSWARVKEALKIASDRGLDIKLNAVVTSKTLASLENLLEFARKNRLGITVNLVRTGNPKLWNNAAKVRPESDEIRRMFASLAGYSQKSRYLLFPSNIYELAQRWPDYSIDYVEKKDIPSLLGKWEGPQCQAGRYYMSILPDGSVSPCPIRFDADQSINVLDNGVETAWRELQGHTCAACYSPCLVALNSLFSLTPRTLFYYLVQHVPRSI